MDTVFQETVLDTLDHPQKYSVKLTEMVNNILLEARPNATREGVMGFCKKLLVGDDSMPSLNQKSLPYIARVFTGDPPVWKVIVTVTQVTKNLKDVLLNRMRMYKELEMYEQLEIVEIVQTRSILLLMCLNMISTDPRKYTPDELGQFTYMKKSIEPQLPAKRGEPARAESGGEISPKRAKANNDILDGAESLFGLSTTPPRQTIHASPRSREIPTDSSVISQESDVMSMSNAGHSKGAKMLEDFYTHETA